MRGGGQEDVVLSCREWRQSTVYTRPLGSAPARPLSCSLPLPRRAPRSFTRRPEWNSGRQREDIRRQERIGLDIWTNESFYLVGIVAVVVLFAAVLLSAGGPPADPRCTLPWC